MKTMKLTPGTLTLKQCSDFIQEEVFVKLDPQATQAIDRSTACIKKVLLNDKTVYGINTGFGQLANTRIDASELETLQRSIVLSHAAGVGEYLDVPVTRLIMLLKINSLSLGFSGIRLSVIQSLIDLLNAEIYPCIPEKGSVGASGDLAPLAHMSAVLIGEGQASYQGTIYSGKEALAKAGLSPISLHPKEGLALLNGTQVSTALALIGLFEADNLMASSLVIGALSIEAANGSRRPFDKRIHAARGHNAQIMIAQSLRHLLDESEIEKSHSHCTKVQDPYSLRCQPQVLGACLQQLRHAASILLIEANGVSDNPLIFTDTDEIISGGNFHAEPVAMAADNIALAISEMGAISERRLSLLIDSKLSGLPPFLVNNGGVNSGFMVAQVTSAALASENKSLAHPASVDSLPTSANQEDHVSMATFAARRLRDMNKNTQVILAIEWLAACQGIDFRAPFKTSTPLEAAKSALREWVPFYEKDKYFAPDIEKATKLIANHRLFSLGSEFTSILYSEKMAAQSDYQNSRSGTFN
ncbi:MAG: histidine ammonia-lyase [Cellvibrionales bacterium]|nr:histidine ammonia-lyase [Cellvibrionales bacterium]